MSSGQASPGSNTPQARQAFRILQKSMFKTLSLMSSSSFIMLSFGKLVVSTYINKMVCK
ncbi:hypothetical protein HanPSC8_Chr15g0656791 [Helianthus annuus]|nr:hypothetical protein HanPSC8_Chr15g0656791 [Helianthus annuus]